MKIVEGIIDQYLAVVWEQKGSDLHLTTESAPRGRVDGRLRPIEGAPILTGEMIWEALEATLNQHQIKRLRDRHEVDFSFSWRGTARIRANAFLQKGEPALALRVIPSDIPSFETLGLPAAVQAFTSMTQGLVLFTGPTGSGKSTSLASLINKINATRPLHILTIEDPVEYVHSHKMSAISQREVGADSVSFAFALRSALREDPDVILVGEMRDPESIAITLTLAETGHLVFSTLHTNDTSQALDRMVDVFPPEQQEQIRVQLAGALSAVVAQRLIVKKGGGRVAAFEVLIASPAVRNLIREGKTRQIRNMLVTGQGMGMQTLEMSLNTLVKRGLITNEDAMAIALVPTEIGR